MEKNVRLGWLLDRYGTFLTARQRNLLSLHVNDDLSLAEIAEQEGISRQGVHDALKRGEEQLAAFEERLGLLQVQREAGERLHRLEGDINALPVTDSNKQELCGQIQALRQLLEDRYGV
ncbi:MAG: sigma factor-like helix-turn-helix DNA-binding protein [Eubacteriales bacterium]|nr:sigma factor-like helix-turn-helix DNA-binding protein [Eubacteriales bacterium]